VPSPRPLAALAAAAFFVIAGCATHHTRACLSGVGCPKPPPREDCSRGGAILELADVLRSGGGLVGQRISVRGPLTRGFGACVIRGCRSKKCCNDGCSAFVELRVPHTCEPPCPIDDWTQALLLDGLLCLSDSASDDSSVPVTMCCPFAVDGQVAVARGTLHRDEGRTGFYHLVDAAICAGSP
jgi:hypothetical protein